MSAAAVARLLDGASLLVTALGLGVAAFVLATTGRPWVALAVLLEMLTGAGLLHLAAAPTPTSALGAAGVLLVRRLVTFGLHGGDPTGRFATAVRTGLRGLRAAASARR